MIILYRNKEDEFADKVVERLKNLVVAHKVVVKGKSDSTEYNLPYLQEGATIIDKRDKIEKFLNELSSEVIQQRRITGDACYIDPETGSVC